MKNFKLQTSNFKTNLPAGPLRREASKAGPKSQHGNYNNNIKYIVWILTFGFGILILLFAASLLQSANPFDESRYKVNIPEGSSAYTVQRILEEEEILRSESSFAFAARVLGVTKDMRAGEYRFSPSETLLGILLKLKRGEVIKTKLRRVMLTFPEGTSIYKMGEILRKNNVSDPDKFQSLVKEGITEALRGKHWTIFKYVPSESLEGYLYPDTYWFFDSAEVDEIVETMVSRFEEVVLPFWNEVSKEAEFNLHEILTLASIIEKEVKVQQERAIISSVYYNRLKADMPLAADPTIKYALDKPTKRVLRNQLSVDSPYNTYKRKGLPPGPICNPGIESIKAAVYPAKTNYYYFVAKKDGSHIFSRSWKEHQRARQTVTK